MTIAGREADKQDCGCIRCLDANGRDESDPLKRLPSRKKMVLCAICGNKRCPHANDHQNACTGSNAPGQPGSAYAKWTADKPTPPAEPHADAGKMVAVGEGREYDEIGVPIGLREMTISQEAADQIDRIMREPSSLKIVPQRIEVVGEATAVTERLRGEVAEAAELNNEMKRLLDEACDQRDKAEAELTALREQLAAAERELQSLRTIYREADNDRLEVGRQHGIEAEKWKSEDDWYGWNYHKGYESGTIGASFAFCRIAKAIDAAIAKHEAASAKGGA